MSEVFDQFEPNQVIRAHKQERLLAMIAESHFLLKAFKQQKEIADLILPKASSHRKNNRGQARNSLSDYPQGRSSTYLSFELYNPWDNEPADSDDWPAAMKLLMQQTAPEPEISDESR